MVRGERCEGEEGGRARRVKCGKGGGRQADSRTRKRPREREQHDKRKREKKRRERLARREQARRETRERERKVAWHEHEYGRYSARPGQSRYPPLQKVVGQGPEDGPGQDRIHRLPYGLL